MSTLTAERVTQAEKQKVAAKITFEVWTTNQSPDYYRSELGRAILLVEAENPWETGISHITPATFFVKDNQRWFACSFTVLRNGTMTSDQVIAYNIHLKQLATLLASKLRTYRQLQYNLKGVQAEILTDTAE